ncbi:hypothetical protein SEA_PUREGLOBE5_84 [Arthrobacter phage Pureglobe5]|nr:hypothetical protein SEA_PUREGLOBE5_84 [Arthrobacter phage Pureglobe5]
MSASEEYWPLTEASPLLTKIEQLVYEQTGQRPFYLWNGDPEALTEAGKEALNLIKIVLNEVQEALY